MRTLLSQPRVSPTGAEGIDANPPVCVIVGSNPVSFWGLSQQDRLQRLMAAHGLVERSLQQVSGPGLLVNASFVFDPMWFRHFASLSGAVLTMNDVPVLAACRTEAECSAVARAMDASEPLPAGLDLVIHRVEGGATLINDQLRKREQPFVMPLTARTVRAAERASYFGAYKGVTDLLTKYLWPEWALVLTRIAARIGLSPNMVTTIGAIFCVLATYLFWEGRYWEGMAAGLVFMVLDTVDGKLARCTITSSKWGNIFDHGLDLVHPPFWWYAWAHGLSHYGQSISPALLDGGIAILIAGYVVQRLIEGIFIRRYGMHIHVWRKIDSDFRLITARRNPNMVILFASMLLSRPDIGFVAIVAWTVLSCVFHLVRLGQAMLDHHRGRAIRSWLEEA